MKKRSCVYKFRHLMLIASLLFCPVMAVVAQTPREEQYKKIEKMAIEGFQLKAGESKLSGTALKNQITKRTRQFLITARELNIWIEEYYPRKDSDVTTGYVKACFILGLYMEYAAGYRYAQRQYLYVDELLYELNQKNLPEPEYNGVKISKWVQDKLLIVSNISRKIDETDSFEFDILKSKISDLQKALSIILTLTKNDEFGDLITGDRDKLFAVQQAARTVADSVAPEDLALWSAIYFNNILNASGLKYTKDSCSEYQLWCVGTDTSFRTQVTGKLNSILIDLRRFIPPGKLLKPSSFVINCLEDSILSGRDFQKLIDLQSTDNPDIFSLDGERWRYRNNIVSSRVKTSDSLLNNLFVGAARSWILNDFDKSPPAWLIGLPLLYFNYDSSGQVQTYHLYAIQTALEIDKLPSIKDFMANPNTYFEHIPYSFGEAYSRYLCFFLDSKGFLTDLYNDLHADSLLWDADQMAKRLEKVFGFQMFAINSSFRDFIRNIDPAKIPASDQIFKESVQDYTKKFLENK